MGKISQPTNVTAKKGQNGIHVSWDAVPDAKRYEVYVSPNSSVAHNASGKPDGCVATVQAPSTSTVVQYGSNRDCVDPSSTPSCTVLDKTSQIYVGVSAVDDNNIESDISSFVLATK